MVKTPNEKDTNLTDKATERLRQFEGARSPQVVDDDIFAGIDELIQELLDRREDVTDRAARRLMLFKDVFTQREKKTTKGDRKDNFN